MSSQPPFLNGSGGDSSPLPVYAKTFDHGFNLVCGVSLRVRVFRPLWKRSLAPLVLLCWTLTDKQAATLKEMAEPLRREMMRLPCRVSLVERFVHRGSGEEPGESIHKVLELLPEDKGGGAVLLPLRRSVLESLIGETLDEPRRDAP